MAFVDYYQILGLAKTASPKNIKDAYRKLARKYHPDLNPTDKTAKKRFQEINEANEVLSDPEKRKKFDQYGQDWDRVDQSAQQPGPGRQQSQSRYAGASDDSDFSSFFESMFGGAQGGQRSRQVRFRGENYNAELQLDLIDAFKTHKKTITVNGINLRITIPAGIENGQTIKVAGHGSPGINGGPNGDLLITFSIANHPKIKRLGNNLYTSVDLDLYTAILGGEITLDTLQGKVKLKVKPETQNGSEIKLKGQGFPAFKKEGLFGDLFITYSIKIPTGLSEKQKQLFTELSEIKP